MNGKKIVICGSVFIAIIIVLIMVWINTNDNQKDYLLIKDDDLYFGMTVRNLIDIKGEPDETCEDVGDTFFHEYVYQEKIEGYSANCIYGFQRSHLQYATVTIDHMNYESAKDMTVRISGRQKEHYLKYDGYYCSEFEKDESAKSFSLSLGTNNGATGIALDFDYNDDTLTISAIEQK